MAVKNGMFTCNKHSGDSIIAPEWAINTGLGSKVNTSFRSNSALPLFFSLFENPLSTGLILTGSTETMPRIFILDRQMESVAVSPEAESMCKGLTLFTP